MGVSQGTLSLYESGRRDPSLTTLERMLEALGGRVDISVVEGPSRAGGPTAPTLAALRARGAEVNETLARHGLLLRGAFGSVARERARPDSDIDLLVSVPSGVGLFAILRAQDELERILGHPVDLVPDSGLKPHLRNEVEDHLVVL